MSNPWTDELTDALNAFEDVKVCHDRLIKVSKSRGGDWTYVWQTMTLDGQLNWGFKWVSGTYADWDNDDMACTG